MTTDERISLFQEAITCDGNIYTWCYDSDGQLLYSNCPQEMLLATAFSLLGGKAKALSHGQVNSEPITTGTSLGLVWAVAYEKNQGNLHRFFVFGPVFTADASFVGIHKALKHYGKLELSMTWMSEFERALERLPVVPSIIMTRYAMMFHYFVTEKKISPSDVFRWDANIEPELGDMPIRDRHQVWQNEKEMLRMVREGDINYQKALDASSMLSSGVPIKGTEPLRQIKTSLTVFTSLCTRAAIEGGLSPEQAYSLGDAYIQTAEEAETYDDIAPIGPTMYSDFVHRVRKCRTNPRFTRQIQNVVDYIELHVEEKIRLSALADYVGYTEYYLSRKFKSEVGCTVNDYIRYSKMEKAKALLATTEQSIQSISEQLGYCSRSYFGTIFGKVVGCTPVDYRKYNKSI
ncbi:AraC family transcriptional regulator [Ruminococcaceae bacterium OttesenSCG-928-A11]|nr:AraC family transcriptional regulator [Ruminococcaceae bacterium OttesenSCG-928-A11]